MIEALSLSSSARADRSLIHEVIYCSCFKAASKASLGLFHSAGGSFIAANLALPPLSLIKLQSLQSKDRMNIFPHSSVYSMLLPSWGLACFIPPFSSVREGYSTLWHIYALHIYLLN